MRSPRFIALSVALAGLTTLACEYSSSSSPRSAANPPPGYYGQQPPPGYGQPGYQQPGQPGYAPQPGYGTQPPAVGAPPNGAPPPSTTAPAPPPVTNLPPVANDPINAVDINFLRTRAQAVIQELIAALGSQNQSRVNGIPLIVDDRVGNVNAFAACTQSGKSVMSISDGLLDIEAHLAQTKATDEIFGTNKTDEYIKYLAKYQKPNAPIVRPPAGFFNPTQQTDARKVKRQHEILDEQIAFVLGHELGHHYLGHLPCTASGAGAVTAAEAGHILSGVIPIFNQPNELAADVAGTQNVLAAGNRRAAYHWTENGGLLTMQFFSGLDSFSPVDIVFGFERSHPPPFVRTPVIKQTAASYRSGNTSPLPFPIPGFGF
ncbi:MAG: M48 family metalloprotease [Polyangiaceae bacterium]